MRVLITGASGYLGYNFIERFHNELEIIAIVKNKKNKKLIKFSNIKIEYLDIREKSILKLFKKYKPEVVIHLASLNEKMPKFTKDIYDINVFGTENIIKSCIDIGAKLVFTSTREVYGNKFNKIECKENFQLNPTNTYGITKMLAENLITNAGKNYSLRYMILRITNIYGSNNRRGLNKILFDAIEKNKITIFGGEQEVNPIFINDVLEILKKSINLKFNREIINVGSDETLTIKEFCRIIQENMTNNLKIEIEKLSKETTFAFRPNNKKMKNRFKIKPISIRNGIRNTLNYKKFPNKNYNIIDK